MWSCFVPKIFYSVTLNRNIYCSLSYKWWNYLSILNTHAVEIDKRVYKIKCRNYFHVFICHNCSSDFSSELFWSKCVSCPSSLSLSLTFHIFIFFSRTTQPIFQPNLAQSILKFVKIKDQPLFQGDNYEIAKTHWRNLSLLLKNHFANFNQTWHKASLGEEKSGLFKWRASPFSKGS